MIHLQRPATPPAVLGQGGRGETETNKAIQHFLHGGPEKPEFTAYGDKPVKKALIEAFHGKCAYCESLIAKDQDGDVEHYRPKGAVVHEDGSRTQGYYWLAAEWKNLLPSCTLCNQLRNSDMANGSVAGTGKGNYFPLKDEAKRARRPGDEVHEEPLLLNPCVHQPADHLRFDVHGIVAHITPEGEKSIEIYGLNRKWLKEAREQRSLLLQATIWQIQSLLKTILRRKDAGEDFTHEWADAHEGVQRLIVFTADDKEFAAVARALVEPLRLEVERFRQRVVQRGA